MQNQQKQKDDMKVLVKDTEMRSFFEKKEKKQNDNTKKTDHNKNSHL